MLLLAPILLYMLSGLAIAIWHAFRQGYGVPWLASVGVCLVGWGGMLYLRLRIPVTLAGQAWLGLGETAQYPYFLLDGVSWPYAFALSGLALATVLTASARLAYRSNPYTWAAILALAGAGVLAVTAADPLTLAVSWTAIDVMELLALLVTVRNKGLSLRVVVAFAARIVGVFVLVWAMLYSRSLGVDLNFAAIPTGVSQVLLLAAGLRLGALPLHLTLREEIPMRRGLGTMLRSTAPASSLALLARLPAQSAEAIWLPLLLTLVTLAVLYTALAWLSAENALSGRPYWVVALSALALICVLRGQPQASIAWGLALILPGSLLFLFSARDRGTLVMPLLGALGLAGLPFTPAAAGWLGLWSQPFEPANLFFLFAHAALLAGYIRHIFVPVDSLASMERWVQGMYPFGLFILIATQFIAAWFSLPQSFSLATWVGILAALLALGGVTLLNWLLAPRPGGEPGWPAVLGGRVGRWLGAIFRLDWFYRLGMLAYAGARRFVAVLANILEGDGGVLWVLVLLALLISLLRVEGSP